MALLALWVVSTAELMPPTAIMVYQPVPTAYFPLSGGLAEAPVDVSLVMERVEIDLYPTLIRVHADFTMRAGAEMTRQTSFSSIL